MRGFLIFVVFAVIVWIGGSFLMRYQAEQRENVYGKVWAAAPDLERAHTNVSTELRRLNESRRDLVKRKRMFENEQAKASADRKIAGVDRQIERLEAQRMNIIGAVEKQSVVNVSTKIENPLQREKIASLEAAASEAVEDAVSLRRAIESGVASDSGAGPRRSEPASRDMPASSRSAAPSESRSDLLKRRTWRDRHGHSVTATLITVTDSSGRTVATLGMDPSDLWRGGNTVHLQRNDGKIIQVPLQKFSRQDIIFLVKGR